MPSGKSAKSEEDSEGKTGILTLTDGSVIMGLFEDLKRIRS